MKKGINKILKSHLVSIRTDKVKIILNFILYIIIRLNFITSFKTSHFICFKYSYIRIKINGIGFNKVFSD